MSNWKRTDEALGEHFSSDTGNVVILADPELPDGSHWLRERVIPADGRRFLQALPGSTIVYYVPCADDEGFPSQSPRYEGHWCIPDEDDDAPPSFVADETWSDRATFVQLLDEIEARAAQISFRRYECFRHGGWEWPAALRDYIAEHGVRPSEDFIAFVYRSKSPLASG